MDIKEKIQEQLTLLLDCENDSTADLIIKRIQTLIDVDSHYRSDLSSLFSKS